VSFYDISRVVRRLEDLEGRLLRLEERVNWWVRYLINLADELEEKGLDVTKPLK